jgi:hypothetical protein
MLTGELEAVSDRVDDGGLLDDVSPRGEWIGAVAIQVSIAIKSDNHHSHRDPASANVSIRNIPPLRSLW